MEAAWRGDLEVIKSMTLQAWGPENEHPPLLMEISDGAQNTPFSLAFLNRHFDVARAILEIVKAQWSPAEKNKLRYRMETTQNDDEEYNSDDETSIDGADETNEPRIVSENLDKQFTINDIGRVSMQVQSHTKPLAVIRRSVLTSVIKNGQVVNEVAVRSLFTHVVDIEDNAGLKFLLELAQHYSGQKFERDDEDEVDRFVFPMESFLLAIQNGKIQQLSLAIKRTGAGIPLDDLVKKSGVEMQVKPRYYQGLTVYGKRGTVSLEILGLCGMLTYAKQKGLGHGWS